MLIVNPMTNTKKKTLKIYSRINEKGIKTI
jgi:hypothetical protein